MSWSRHVGKIRKRLEDVKNQWARPARADFNDNESARLATDALLDGGPEAYRRVLSQEGEVDFLSSLEAQYIQAQATEPCCAPESLRRTTVSPLLQSLGASAPPKLHACTARL